MDGPGIRFVIFLQGCHLKCKYCHNRDTWDKNSGTEVLVDDLIPKILRYKNYILPSGGGVTITGGEPLLQAKPLLLLLKKLKELEIPTCIDTSGMIKITKNIEELISFTDLFLLDIKHIDDKKCQALVGHSNKLEFEFTKYLDQHNKKMWIRYVLIPGYTDHPKDLQKLKSFASKLKMVEKIELLPYHNMGKYKWENLEFPYELEETKNATDVDLEVAKNILGIH